MYTKEGEGEKQEKKEIKEVKCLVPAPIVREIPEPDVIPKFIAAINEVCVVFSFLFSFLFFSFLFFSPFSKSHSWDVNGLVLVVMSPPPPLLSPPTS